MNKNKNRLIIGALVALAIVVLIFGALRNNRGTSPGGGTTIPIGAVLPLTGPYAALGVGEQEGMSLAADQINQKGGIHGKKLVLQFEDSKAQAADGVAAVQKLLNVDGCRYIFTSTTGVSLAAKPILAKLQAVQVVFAMDETIPKDADNVFRIYPGVREEGRALLRYTQTRKPKTVAIIYLKNPAYESETREVLEPGLHQQGVTEVTSEVFDVKDPTAARTIATKLSASKPDLIVLCTVYSPIGASAPATGSARR